MTILLRHIVLTLTLVGIIGSLIVPSTTLAATCVNMSGAGTSFLSGVYVTCPDGVPQGSVIDANGRVVSTTWSQSIYQALASLGGYIGMIGGSLLDIALSLFTVNMARTAEVLGLQGLIASLWGIIRDLFNIIFIFGLIWAGFRMILWTDDSSSKKLIGSIVIAALLINFSLYATQIVVDFTNVAAYQIHRAMSLPDQGTSMAGIEISSISLSFSQAAKMEQLVQNRGTFQVGISSSTPGGGLIDSFGIVNALLLGITMLAFFCVLAFVFAAGAFILFSRFIALIILMIFSPIMFLGSIFPRMQTYTSQWWQLLFKQALVGPAFLFMLYLSLQAVSGLTNLNDSGIMAMILYVVIVAGFLIASLKVAQNMSNWGAYQAYNVGSKLQGTVGGLVARQTAGRGSNWAQNKFTAWQAKDSKNFLGKALRRGVAATNLDRGIINVTNQGKKVGLGGTSYDDKKKQDKERKQRIAKSRTEQELGNTITNGSSAAPNSAERRKFEQAIQSASTSALIGQLGEHKPSSTEYRAIINAMSVSQFDDVLKAKDEDLSEDQKNNLRIARRQVVEQQIVDPNNQQNYNQLTAAQKQQQLIQNIGRAEAAQLRALGAETILDPANNPVGGNGIIRNLKPSQIEDIKKSDRYSAPQKSQIIGAWETAMVNRYTSAPMDIRLLRADEVAKLPKGIFTTRNQNNQLAITPALTASMLPDLKKTLTTQEYSTIWNEIVTQNPNQSRNPQALRWITTPQAQAQQGASLHP